MAIPGGALRFQDCCEQAGGRPDDAASLKSLAPKLLTARLLTARLLTLGVILCSMSFAGCARNPAQREVGPALHEDKAPSIRAPLRTRRPVEPYRHAEPKIRRPDLALLSPQPAPDCEFKRSDLKTVDPDEWARLKVEYERQCYLDAEKAARERLALLQASSTCEIEPVRQRRPVR
jgi:hypothetical protein